MPSRKGSPNKITSELKEMILCSLHGVGGIKYLEKQAEKNPNAYLALIGKTLPMTVEGGDENKPIGLKITWDRSGSA